MSLEINPAAKPQPKPKPQSPPSSQPVSLNISLATAQVTLDTLYTMGIGPQVNLFGTPTALPGQLVKDDLERLQQFSSTSRTIIGVSGHNYLG